MMQTRSLDSPRRGYAGCLRELDHYGLALREADA